MCTLKRPRARCNHGIEIREQDDGNADPCLFDEGERTILSNILSSQVVHQEYGGVVPELASRAHLTALAPMVRRALEAADVTLADLDAVAATYMPGLVGSLLVGLTFAKSLAWSRSLPLWRYPTKHRQKSWSSMLPCLD